MNKRIGELMNLLNRVEEKNKGRGFADYSIAFRNECVLDYMYMIHVHIVFFY